jgi:hypothetical protein
LERRIARRHGAHAIWCTLPAILSIVFSGFATAFNVLFAKLKAASRKKYVRRHHLLTLNYVAVFGHGCYIDTVNTSCWPS